MAIEGCKNMRTSSLAIACVLLWSASSSGLLAGEVLDNEKLMKMMSAKISLDVILNQITTNLNDCHFSASSDALIAIQKAGDEGQWSKEDIQKLQKKIQEVSKRDEKRLADLVEKSLNIFDNADEAEYAATMNALKKEDAAVVPYLVAKIEQESERKRSGVLDALGRIGDKSPQTVKTALLMLTDRRSKPVRLEAAKCVAALAGPQTCDDLIGMLNNSNDKLDGVAMALGFIGDAKAIEPLTKTLRLSGDSDARVCAAFALGELRAKTPVAIDALLEGVLDERDEKLRDASARALSRTAEKRLPAYIRKAFDRFRPGREEIIQHLAKFKDISAAEWLAELTENDDPKIKAAALVTLQVMTGEKFETSEEWKGWIEVNRFRPDWVRSNTPAPKVPDARSAPE